MKMAEIAYAAYELMIEKMSQANKRLIVVIIILTLALVGTNVAWIIYESSYETYVYDVQSGDGIANYIGNDGDIINGESNSDKEN